MKTIYKILLEARLYILGGVFFILASILITFMILLKPIMWMILLDCHWETMMNSIANWKFPDILIDKLHNHR